MNYSLSLIVIVMFEFASRDIIVLIVLAKSIVFFCFCLTPSISKLIFLNFISTYKKELMDYKSFTQMHSFALHFLNNWT